MGGVTHRLGDLVLGLAAFTPFGGQSQWSQNDAFSGNATYPGAVDGVQRWYSINGELRSTYFSLAGAYDFGALQVGLSANLIYSVVNTLRARSPDGTNNLATEGRSWIDASSLDPSFGIGAVYQPIRDKLWIGASYQSLPNVVGGMKLDGTLRTVFATNAESKNDVTFHEDLPDVFRLGGRYRPTGDTELRLFFDYQRWSMLDNHCVAPPGKDCEVDADGSPAAGSEVILNQVRNWHDTFGARVGGSYWVAEPVELFTGGGFSSNAIPDSTLEPALPDFNTFTVALGGRFGVTDWLRLAASYTQVIYLTRDTTGESLHPTLQSVSRGPDSGGRYAQQLGFVNLYAEAAF
jgi:long-chain fatty acid transport protein